MSVKDVISNEPGRRAPDPVAPGRVAVVTGAASGIGFGLAERFAAEGMHVVMADVEEPALTKAASALADAGASVLPVATDVASLAAVEALRDSALAAFGAVHVVCNNAGVAGGGPSWDVPLATWNWIMGVNFYGILHGIRSFLPHLLAQSEGHIVNTASVAGLLAGPWTAPYTVSKHAAVALSETLYYELAAAGSPVGVSVLCPGWVKTRIGESGRNWVGRYGPSPEDDEAARPLLDQVREATAAAIESGSDPADIATAVRDAVVDGQFWILTHPEFGERVVSRYTRAAEGVNPGLANPWTDPAG
jgi:NAD(P)-dependent dehydrogenase (short-subunit alcohol dehydrogenase family)